ncbi:MAG: hypothetical protein JSW47_06845 [Phycisphaerales bacterium]|nr:MAG: hypothetical protein JSW47_06845 [Phycisphaerales bacterium]
MNIYESLSSPGFMLNEQIARQVFEILPETGPLMLIMDRQGNTWPSNSHDFAELNISESLLREVCAKIDDGAEPVMTLIEDCSIVAAQLATDRSNCGYVVLALPKYSPESTLANIDLIEMLLNQLSLIARLIEKGNQLYEVHMKHYHLPAESEIVSN